MKVGGNNVLMISEDIPHKWLIPGEAQSGANKNRNAWHQFHAAAYDAPYTAFMYLIFLI